MLDNLDARWHTSFDMEKMTTLRRIRLLADITQKDLAAATGTTRQNLFKIERGKSLPRVLLAQRIAKTLGCTVADLWPLPEDETA